MRVSQVVNAFIFISVCRQQKSGLSSHARLTRLIEFKQHKFREQHRITPQLSDNLVCEIRLPINAHGDTNCFKNELDSVLGKINEDFDFPCIGKTADVVTSVSVAPKISSVETAHVHRARLFRRYRTERQSPTVRSFMNVAGCALPSDLSKPPRRRLWSIRSHHMALGNVLQDLHSNSSVPTLEHCAEKPEQNPLIGTNIKSQPQWMSPLKSPFVSHSAMSLDSQSPLELERSDCEDDCSFKTVAVSAELAAILAENPSIFSNTNGSPCKFAQPHISVVNLSTVDLKVEVENHCVQPRVVDNTMNDEPLNLTAIERGGTAYLVSDTPSSLQSTCAGMGKSKHIALANQTKHSLTPMISKTALDPVLKPTPRHWFAGSRLFMMMLGLAVVVV